LGPWRLEYFAGPKPDQLGGVRHGEADLPGPRRDPGGPPRRAIRIDLSGEVSANAEPDTPRIIIHIIAVHMIAAKMKPAFATPVATSTTAMTSIGIQHATIIPP
jgi:hypothetical protein